MVDDVGKVFLKHRKTRKISISVKDNLKSKSSFCKVRKANSPCLCPP